MLLCPLAGCGIPHSIASLKGPDGREPHVLVGLRNGRVIVFTLGEDAQLRAPTVRRLGESPVSFCSVLTAAGIEIVAMLQDKAYRSVPLELLRFLINFGHSTAFCFYSAALLCSPNKHSCGVHLERCSGDG